MSAAAAAVVAERADRAVGRDEQRRMSKRSAVSRIASCERGPAAASTTRADLIRRDRQALDERLAAAADRRVQAQQWGRVRDVTSPCGPATTMFAVSGDPVRAHVRAIEDSRHGLHGVAPQAAARRST